MHNIEYNNESTAKSLYYFSFSILSLQESFIFLNSMKINKRITKKAKRKGIKMNKVKFKLLAKKFKSMSNLFTIE